MVKYIGKIVDEIEDIDTNLFDGATDTILLNIEKAEDEAFTNADKGIAVMAVRDDTPPTAKGANNDYMPLLVDSKGQLYVIGEHDLAIKNAVEIIDDWDDGSDHCEVKEHFGGAAYTARITSSNSRVAMGSIKLRDVVIRNDHASYEVCIGDGADISALRGQGYELDGGASVGFVKIDLATLFIVSSTDAEHAIIHIIGTRE